MATFFSFLFIPYIILSIFLKYYITEKASETQYISVLSFWLQSPRTNTQSVLYVYDSFYFTCEFCARLYTYIAKHGNIESEQIFSFMFCTSHAYLDKEKTKATYPTDSRKIRVVSFCVTFSLFDFLSAFHLYHTYKARRVVRS